MSSPGDTRLNLLLFTVGGVRFGCDAGQVAGMTAGNGEEADDLFWFHEEVGFQGRAVAYRSPTIVTVRRDGPRPYRVIIDAMDEIAEFGRHDIRLFPALLEPYAMQRGLWGILPRGGEMVLLVDFLLLLKKKPSKID